MNDINTELIENYMKENKLSKTAFCKKCGICTQSFKKVMTGQNFRLRILFKISETMDVKLSKMFVGPPKQEIK